MRTWLLTGLCIIGFWVYRCYQKIKKTKMPDIKDIPEDIVKTYRKNGGKRKPFYKGVKNDE